MSERCSVCFFVDVFAIFLLGCFQESKLSLLSFMRDLREWELQESETLGLSLAARQIRAAATATAVVDMQPLSPPSSLSPLSQFVGLWMLDPEHSGTQPVSYM